MIYLYLSFIIYLGAKSIRSSENNGGIKMKKLLGALVLTTILFGTATTSFANETVTEAAAVSTLSTDLPHQH